MRHLSAALIVIGLALPAAAQDAPAAAQPPAPEASPDGEVAPDGAAADGGPVAGFIYKPEGRRDPFVSLVRRGTELVVESGVLEGVAALTVDEVALRGVLRTPQGNVALIEGADARTYIVRSGDALRDGTVELIADEDMVIRQWVDDPPSLESEREVRKTLRQIDEAAQ